MSAKGPRMRKLMEPPPAEVTPVGPGPMRVARERE
jgi:hypothetical protein